VNQISQFLRRVDGGVMHFCPACACGHVFYIEKKAPGTNAQWKWDANIVEPTFQPSMVVTAHFSVQDGGPEVCHYWLRKGVIEYLNDCTHHFKGLKVPLPAMPAYLRDPAECLNF
jgi:hypothetical protein